MLLAGPWTDTASTPLSGTDHSFWPPGVRTAADDARVAAYGSALAFYHGAQWQERARRGESRLVLNYARALVRKTASYVFPGPVAFSALAPADDPGRSGGRQPGRTPAGGLLAAELDLGRLDLALAIDAAVLGDAAIKVTWDRERAQPRVAAVDPAVAGGAVGAGRPGDARTG